MADISFRERLAQFDGYNFIAPINQRLQFLSLKNPPMLKEDKSRTKLKVTNLVENLLELMAHVHSKVHSVRAELNFAQTGNTKITRS